MSEFVDRWSTAVTDVVRLVIAADGAQRVVSATHATTATFVELWRTAPSRPLDQSVRSWALATAQRVTRVLERG